MNRLILLLFLLPVSAFAQATIYFSNPCTNSMLVTNVYAQFYNPSTSTAQYSSPQNYVAFNNTTTPVSIPPPSPGFTLVLSVNGGGGWSVANNQTYTLTCGQYPSTNVIVYTNYTLCAQNPGPGPETATWTYDGSVVKSETLTEGGSDCWTTPPIEVSPTPQFFTFSETSTPIQQYLTYNTNGNLSFGGGGDGGGGGPTLSGTPGGLTNNIVPPENGGPGGYVTNINVTNITFVSSNAPISPGTNQIIYQTPTGAASESTLQAVGSVLHNDLNNILNGESILNSTMLHWEVTQTNQLGQVITLLMAATNNDSPAEIVAAITNLQSHLTNNVVVNVPSNNVSLSISNYATETSLDVVTDLMTQFMNETNQPGQFTNVISYVGYTNATDAAGASSSFLNGFENEVSGYASSLTAPLIPISSAPDMTFNIEGFGVIDFNPLNNAEIANIFSISRTFWTWLLCLLFLTRCSNDLWKAISIMNQAHGVQPMSDSKKQVTQA